MALRGPKMCLDNCNDVVIAVLEVGLSLATHAGDVGEEDSKLRLIGPAAYITPLLGTLPQARPWVGCLSQPSVLAVWITPIVDVFAAPHAAFLESSGVHSSSRWAAAPPPGIGGTLRPRMQSVRRRVLSGDSNPRLIFWQAGPGILPGCRVLSY